MTTGKTATYVGDPSDENSGKAKLVMKKRPIFPAEGKAFKMNVATEVTDAEHAWLKGHSHFEVSPSEEEAEALEPDETGDGDGADLFGGDDGA